MQSGRVLTQRPLINPHGLYDRYNFRLTIQIQAFFMEPGPKHDHLTYLRNLHSIEDMILCKAVYTLNPSLSSSLLP